MSLPTSPAYRLPPKEEPPEVTPLELLKAVAFTVVIHREGYNVAHVDEAVRELILEAETGAFTEASFNRKFAPTYYGEGYAQEEVDLFFFNLRTLTEA